MFVIWVCWQFLDTTMGSMFKIVGMVCNGAGAVMLILWLMNFKQKVRALSFAVLVVTSLFADS